MRFEQESLHSTLHQRHKMVIALIPYFCDEFWRKFELNGHTPILPNLFSISLKPQFVPAFSIINIVFVKQKPHPHRCGSLFIDNCSLITDNRPRWRSELFNCLDHIRKRSELCNRRFLLSNANAIQHERALEQLDSEGGVDSLGTSL